MTDWPATVSVPVRGLVSALAATVYDIVPEPVAPPPAVMVIQAAPLVAVQTQPDPAVTPTVDDPPAAGAA